MCGGGGGGGAREWERGVLCVGLSLRLVVVAGGEAFGVQRLYTIYFNVIFAERRGNN